MKNFRVNVREKTTEYGFMPTLQMYLVEGKNVPRPIVIIVPGGGYTKVCMESDGDRVALQFNAAGFHVAVLNYSVFPHYFPEPQIDLMLAVKMVRENAQKWGIAPNQIALCGVSAGGHLCATISTLWYKSGEKLFKPNAAILCFAPLTTRLQHCRSFLAGMVGSEDEEKLGLVSCDEQVSEHTPPTFLYGTNEDKLANVENILYYAEGLSEYKVPFEVHIFPKGGHGASWCDEVIWGKQIHSRNYNYIKLSIEWLQELFEL